MSEEEVTVTDFQKCFGFSSPLINFFHYRAEKKLKKMKLSSVC